MEKVVLTRRFCLKVDTLTCRFQDATPSRNWLTPIMATRTAIVIFGYRLPRLSPSRGTPKTTTSIKFLEQFISPCSSQEETSQGWLLAHAIVNHKGHSASGGTAALISKSRTMVTGIAINVSWYMPWHNSNCGHLTISRKRRRKNCFCGAHLTMICPRKLLLSDTAL